jgi:hypothetical protein
MILQVPLSDVKSRGSHRSNGTHLVGAAIRLPAREVSFASNGKWLRQAMPFEWRIARPTRESLVVPDPVSVSEVQTRSNHHRLIEFLIYTTQSIWDIGKALYRGVSRLTSIDCCLSLVITTLMVLATLSRGRTILNRCCNILHDKNKASRSLSPI